MQKEEQLRQELSLDELFKLANKIGKKQYHKLTPEDFENYRKYDYWRYNNGDGECGTTLESKAWVEQHSDYHCPVCEQKFGSPDRYRTIDHKLPRSQYPWLSLAFSNLWVICRACNEEKGERHWFEYEHYMLLKHPDLYENLKVARPNKLPETLEE